MTTPGEPESGLKFYFNHIRPSHRSKSKGETNTCFSFILAAIESSWLDLAQVSNPKASNQQFLISQTVKGCDGFSFGKLMNPVSVKLISNSSLGTEWEILSF